MTETATDTWKCTACGENFPAGEWFCANGAKHVVATKSYFLSGGPPQQSGRSEGGAKARPTERVSVVIGGREPIEVPAGSDDWAYGGYVATFEDGRFSTADPEVQWHLNQRQDFVSEARWRELWMTPEEQLAAEKADLESLRAKTAALAAEVSQLRKGAR